MEQETHGASREEDQDRRDLLVFSVHDLRFAVSTNEVEEILRPLPVVPIPRLPAFVVGVVNCRGRVVAVLDLATLAGRDSEDSPRRLIVLRSGDLEAAIPASRIAGIKVFAESAIRDAPPRDEGHQMPYVTEWSEQEGVIHSIIDAVRLLDITQAEIQALCDAQQTK